MAADEHFELCEDWQETSGLLAFEPRTPRYTAGHSLKSLSVRTHDHRGRQVDVTARSLEAHYGAFVVYQEQTASAMEAKRYVRSDAFGRCTGKITIAENIGRNYSRKKKQKDSYDEDLSPEIVIWNEEEMLFIVASSCLELDSLLKIARSMHT